MEIGNSLLKSNGKEGPVELRKKFYKLQKLTFPRLWWCIFFCRWANFIFRWSFLLWSSRHSLYRWRSFLALCKGKSHPNDTSINLTLQHKKQQNQIKHTFCNMHIHGKRELGAYTIHVNKSFLSINSLLVLNISIPTRKINLDSI